MPDAYDTVIHVEEILTIRLPKGTRRRLERRARAQKLSVSQLVRRAIEQDELLTNLASVDSSLCEQVAADLSNKGYLGKTIGIKLRYDNFQSVTRDVTMGSFTADAATIRRQAGLCLKRVDLSRRIRLLGVRVGTLQRAPGAGPARAAGPPAAETA